jgi:hypothetical protein
MQESPTLPGRLRLATPDLMEGAQGVAGDAMAVVVGSSGPHTALALCLAPRTEAHYEYCCPGMPADATWTCRVKALDSSNAAKASVGLCQVIG